MYTRKRPTVGQQVNMTLKDFTTTQPGGKAIRAVFWEFL